MTTPPTPTDETAALAEALHHDYQDDRLNRLTANDAQALALRVIVHLAAAGWFLTRGPLDAAWERVDRALPERSWCVLTSPFMERPWEADAWRTNGVQFVEPSRGPTPVAALTALAEALEARGTG